MSSDRPLLIFGAGGLACDVLELARAAGRAVAGFVVDQPDQPAHLMARPVHQLDALAAVAAAYDAVGAIGSSKRRPFIMRAEAMGFRFVSVIHPAATVAESAKLGPGTVVGAGAIVAAAAVIGGHTLVNRGVMIGHHTRIGDWCTIGPGANIGGHATVGAETQIAIAAVVLDRVRVGTHCFVGAGALVTRDVADGKTVVGAPARPVKGG